MTLGVSPSALYLRVTTLLRPWIVSSHHFTTAVTEGDGSVRVLGHHGSVQPTSNAADAPQRSWVFEKQSCCLRGVGDGGLVSGGYAKASFGFIAQDFTMPM